MNTEKSQLSLKKAVNQANQKIKELEEIHTLVDIGEWEMDIAKKSFSLSWQIILFLRLDQDADTKAIFRFLTKESQYKVTKAIFKAIRYGLSFDLEIELNIDNSRVWVRFIGKPQRSRKKVSRIIGIAQNITKEKENILRLDHYHAGLQILNNIAANANLGFGEQLDIALESTCQYFKLPVGVISKIDDNHRSSIHQHYASGHIETHKDHLSIETENYCQLTFLQDNVFAVADIKSSIYRECQYYQKYGYETYIGVPIWVEGKRFGVIGFYGKESYYRSFVREDVEFMKLLARWVGSTLERYKKEQELLLAKQQAEEASQAKARFLSTMSHEIRTPMNAVIGITHLLIQNNPKPAQLENLKALKFSGENLMSLINDILDFSKIEAGKIELESINFDIQELVSSISKSLGYQAQDKGLQFIQELDPNIPELLKGDPVRLSQILNNLLSNAIKFTEKGSVKLQISVAEKRSNKVTLDFAVTDTGIGIEKSQREQIFDSFTQASSETTRKYGGTGLGLAITKKLLELQGSTIDVEGAIGKGTTFFFSLVFTEGIKKKKPLVKNLVDVEAIPSHLAHKRILLVEDNAMNIIVARQFLLRWKINFDHAENGKVAVKMVKKNNYDLVLMDLQMPVMDGFEATKQIRQFNTEVPIIALSASVILETRQKVYRAGMNDFVTKPFNPKDLYQKLTTFLTSGVAELQ